MAKILCGVTVDEKLYKEYIEKSFFTKSDGGAERKLRYIELVANSKDYKENFPELYAECREIVSSVATEIREHYAAKAGRKEYKAMKHDKFSDYINDLLEIQKQVAETRLNLQEMLEKARNAWAEVANDGRVDERKKTALKLAYLDANKEYSSALNELRASMLKDVENVRVEFESHLSDFYIANGNRLDEGTMRLLNSGIKLKNEEIDFLVEQNRQNPTMLRLVSQYCEEKKLNNANARVCGLLANNGGNSERKAFNEVAELLSVATDKNKEKASVWIKGKNFENVANAAIKKIDGLWVKPEVISGGGKLHE